MLIFDKDTSKDVLRNFLCFYNILNFVTTKKKLLFLTIVKLMSSELPKKLKGKPICVSSFCLTYESFQPSHVS